MQSEFQIFKMYSTLKINVKYTNVWICTKSLLSNVILALIKHNIKLLLLGNLQVRVNTDLSRYT